MATNLLKAIKNLTRTPIGTIRQHYSGINRATSMGESLEHFVRDIFCNSVNVAREQERMVLYEQNFSYLANLNNPPDIMIRNGDAIEVKKIEGERAGIALNSSYPKSKLFANSSMITDECRTCEPWDVKDIIYVIGVLNEDRLQMLWFVYGDCYAADQEVYERIKGTISSGLEAINGIELSETNELGRVNRVDPLGITCLRVRGMWHIDNPIRVFDYLEEIPAMSAGLTVNVIMKRNKYLSFPNGDRNDLQALNDPRLQIMDVRIKSPNNPARLEDAKLITFRA